MSETRRLCQGYTNEKSYNYLFYGTPTNGQRKSKHLTVGKGKVPLKVPIRGPQRKSSGSKLNAKSDDC